jgi:hypothetical protein
MLNFIALKAFSKYNFRVNFRENTFSFNQIENSVSSYFNNRQTYFDGFEFALFAYSVIEELKKY